LVVEGGGDRKGPSGKKSEEDGEKHQTMSCSNGEHGAGDGKKLNR